MLSACSASRTRTSPLAVAMSAETTSSSDTSPDAVFTSTEPSSSADLEVGGARTDAEIRSAWATNPHADSRPSADHETVALPEIHDDLVPPADVDHLDSRIRDRFPRRFVVAQGHELDLDARQLTRVHGDLSSRERHLDGNRAGGLEGGHDRAPLCGAGRRTTRTPSGRCRGGRASSMSGRSTLPKSDGKMVVIVVPFLAVSETL